MCHLAPISLDIVVCVVVAVEAVVSAIFVLALSSGSREVALLALPSTTHTWRIGWVINTSQVAFYFAPSAGNAGYQEDHRISKLSYTFGRA